LIGEQDGTPTRMKRLEVETNGSAWPWGATNDRRRAKEEESGVIFSGSERGHRWEGPRREPQDKNAR